MRVIRVGWQLLAAAALAGCAAPDFLGVEPRWFGPSGRSGIPRTASADGGVDPTPRGVIDPSISQSELLFGFGHWPGSETSRSQVEEARLERGMGIFLPHPDPALALGDGDDRLRIRYGPTLGVGLDRSFEDTQVQERGFTLPVALVTAAVLVEVPLQERQDRARWELQAGYAQGYEPGELRFELGDRMLYAWMGFHIAW